MPNERDTQMQEDMKRAEQITEMAQDIKEFALLAAFDNKLKPTVMLSGLAIALVELNHDYSKGDDEDKDGSLEDMINVLRALHSHYGEMKRLHAIREANEARKEGNIQ